MGGEGERSVEEGSRRQEITNLLLVLVLRAFTANTVDKKAYQVDGCGPRAWTTQRNMCHDTVGGKKEGENEKIGFFFSDSSLDDVAMTTDLLVSLFISTDIIQMIPITTADK